MNADFSINSIKVHLNSEADSKDSKLTMADGTTKKITKQDSSNLTETATKALSNEQIEKSFLNTAIETVQSAAEAVRESLKNSDAPQVIELINLLEKTSVEFLKKQTDLADIDSTTRDILESLQAYPNWITMEEQVFGNEQLHILINYRGSIKEFESVAKANQAYLNDPTETASGTLFHFLAKKQNVEAYIKVLAPLGINFKAQEDNGNTPLIWAVANACNSNAMEILNQGEAMGVNQDYLNVQGMSKNTALMLLAAKGYKNRSKDGQFLKFSNYELMRKIVSLKADVNIQNSDGNTPLHVAVARRDPEMIKILIDGGAKWDIANSDGKTPAQLLTLNANEAEEFISLITQHNVFDVKAFETNRAEVEKLIKSK